MHGVGGKAMDQMNSFMIWFNLLIGVYISYVAITGKGKPYDNDYPKEIKDEVYKLNRLMYAIAGPLLVGSGALELAMPNALWATWLSIGCVLFVIVGYLVVFYSRYGKVLKEARKKKF
jgi:hypothetical protein